MKGGFRVVSTIEERDAIPTGARKQGMRVLVINDSFNEYTLSGGTSNTSWQITQHLAKVHNHQISDVADLQTELDGKAPAMHSHTVDDVTGLQTLLDSKAPTAHSHTFDDVAGLQVFLDSKAPTVHGHTLSEVSGLQTALDGKASATHTHSITDVTGLQGVLDDKAAANHTHVLDISDVTGLQTELDGKAPTLHGHAVADVTGLQTELDGKALTVHGHTVADVTGLQTELDGKALTVHGHTVSAIAGLQTMLDAKAPTTHSHAVADVAGLQTALDGKAATTHVHTIANVTGLQTALDGKASSVHTHTITDVTGLQSTLDGKASSVHAHAIGDVTDLQSTLDGKASSVHAHTIANVTGLQTALDNKFDKTGGTISGNVTITGDLTVQGASVTINASQLTVNDPIITAASGNTTAAAPYAGLKVERGSSDAFMVWNESLDRFVAYMSSDDLATAGTLTDIQASTFYGALSGNASTATKWATPRALTFTGDATGTGNIDGSAAVSIALTVGDDSHNHTISTITGLQTALDGKASSVHAHVIGDVTGLQTALDGKSATTHTHAVATTTANGLMSSADKTKLDGVTTGANNYVHPTTDGNLHVPATSTTNNLKVLKAGATAGSIAWGNVAYSELTGIPSTFTPAAHTHAISDVTGLQTALDGKASSTHTHAISDVTGLQTTLDSKAASSHVHTIANVTGLQTALDGKSDTTHTHAVATTTVNGLMSSADKTKLDGVASGANNYVHPTTDGSLHVPATSTTNNLKVLKAGATAGSIAWGNVAYSELTGVPSTFTPAAHTHTIANVTGLQTALDGKLATTGTAANSSQLQGFVTATGATANTVALRDSAGKITAVDFTMTSDARLKNILSTLDDEAALQQVLRWESVFYQMKGETRIMPGFIAQQIQQISPELVTDNEEFLSVSYALTSAYYAGAIRAIMKRIA